MSEDLHITVVGLERLLNKLGTFSGMAAYGDVAKNLLNRSALAVQGEAMPRTPVKQGHLRRSETVTIDPAPFPTFAKVGSNLAYAPFIEFGTRSDPRSSAPVLRKAGPARMLRGGAVAARGLIEAAIERAKEELQARWRA